MNKLCGLACSADREIAWRPCNIRLGMSGRAVFQCKPCTFIDFHILWSVDVTSRQRKMEESQKIKREEKEEGTESRRKGEM